MTTAVDKALQELARLCGSDAVRSGAEAAAEHSDPFSFVDNPVVPAGVVFPSSVEQVQDVVHIAGRLGVPLWTVSTGRNYAYGGAAPRVPGSIVVDLQRMNQVIHVDAELGYAVVEPGVRFQQLDAYLREHDIPLWVDVPDISWGSVLGNTLERGFGYTSYGNHAEQQCGMEIVLADGEIVRTGMGALPDSNAWPLYKGGYGPSHDGLMYQSNLGIVTKMGLWLMPRPEQATVCMAKVPDADGLGPLVDALRPLMIEGTITSTSMVGNVLAIASMLSDRSQWYDKPTPIPDHVTQEICRALQLGWWNARFALYGAPEVVRARLNRVRSGLAEVPGLELVTVDYPGDIAPELVHPADRAQMGVSSTDLIRMAGWRGGEPAHTDFSLVCPPTGKDAVTQMRLIRRRIESRGFDYAGGFTTYPRHAIALALVSFDRSKVDERQQVARLFPELIADAAAAGYAPYRAHTAFMDTIAESYSYNDHAIRRLNKRLKDALDPQGILSPGKQGIWPSARSSHAG